MNGTNHDNKGSMPQNNSGKNNNQSSPQDFSLIKGVVAIVAGVMLLWATRKILFGMMFFLGGAGLIYFGLNEIGWNKVQHYANMGLAKAKELWNKVSK